MLVEFALALAVIVVAASLFTNAVEILGGRLNLGAGAVGSVLAAVGTALPETMIPIVALLAVVFVGGDSEVASEIGIGAILGAPFMLVTLAMFVVGASALAFRRRREQGSEIRCRESSVEEFPWCRAPGKSVNIDADTIARDVAFFLLFFGVAAGVGIVELLFPLKVVLALLLIAAYALYVRRTLHSGEALEEVPEARASTTEKRLSGSSSQRVNRTPKVTGTVLWKTIAPVMLPRAKVSLPSLTQMTELNFSGSSVASGARTSATRPAGNPTYLAACSTASTKT